MMILFYGFYGVCTMGAAHVNRRAGSLSHWKMRKSSQSVQRKSWQIYFQDV